MIIVTEKCAKIKRRINNIKKSANAGLAGFMAFFITYYFICLYAKVNKKGNNYANPA